MAFRTVEITGPAELHVKNGSLVVEKELSELTIEKDQKNTKKTSPEKDKNGKKARGKSKEEKTKIYIPMEDISTIVCMGAGIRISTLAMAKLCENKISMMMLNEKYLPTGILTAYEANARQSLIMRRQIAMNQDKKDMLWKHIVRKKIENQAEALSILKLDGADQVSAFMKKLDTCKEIDSVEAGAAKTYFQYLLPGINRRDESFENSCLNYGYSIIRNSLSRAIIAAGLLPAFGIHHQNLYNAFNLSDDLIEPFRPHVDLIAYHMKGTEIKLLRNQRKQLAEVLQHAVIMDGRKISVLQAIDVLINDLKKVVMGEAEDIHLPKILPIELLSHIKE
ncbi:MAG: type II CRISPR-associated endonuclease Cas1 [Eubacteriales bacterium]|nr:type II CRISPR-associated endonuclease Cas1 [Eubacteriales bacterium]